MATAKSTTEEDKKAVATVAASANAVVVSDYGDDANGGFDNQTSADYSIPFIDILQANSPELNNDERLRPGMIFNRTTQEGFSGKEGVVFVPSFTDHCFAEWVPRDDGGGYVGRYELGDPVINNAERNQAKKGKLIHKTSRNDLVETFYVFGVLATEDGNFSQCVISFTSTKIGVYRGWMTKARTQQVGLPDGRRVTVPLWGHRFRIKTQLIEKNNYKWFNFTIGFDGATASEARLMTSDPLYQMGKETNLVVKSGAARADVARQGSQEDDDGASNANTVGADPDIPF